MQDYRDEATSALAAAGWELEGCHDLLHLAFSPVCWEVAGGPLRHLSLWWQYRGRTVVGRQTSCRWGRHRYLPYWEPGASPETVPDGLMCLDCGGC